MSEDDIDDKEHEPTQKRLDDARARGEVIQSPDLTGAAAYAGLILTGAAAGAAILTTFGAASVGLLAAAETIAADLTRGYGAPVTGAVVRAAAPFGLFFLVPALCVILALIAQRALLVATERIEPKWSRLNPVAAARHRFGRTGLFEFGKSLVKLIVTSALLGVFLASRLEPIVMAQRLPPALSTGALLYLILQFLALVMAVSLAVGGVDYLWQRRQMIRRNRMSRQELMDEFRQSDGDPQMRQNRRRRAMEIAANRMMADVPRADVVIVNPTHYAVALKWDRSRKAAPVCLAKGTDHIALRIRETAQLAGVPIQSDPPTARAIFASVDVGQEIRPDQYRAVAAAIRFAERMRQRARAQGFGQASGAGPDGGRR